MNDTVLLFDLRTENRPVAVNQFTLKRMPEGFENASDSQWLFSFTPLIDSPDVQNAAHQAIDIVWDEDDGTHSRTLSFGKLRLLKIEDGQYFFWRQHP